MKNSKKKLKEKCFLLDFKVSILSELIEHNKAIYKIREEAILCKDCIRDIDQKLRKLETGK